ncbi:hypothetical protein [Aerosticca soli]|uniref:Cation/multidrug efflux pump n=1 Tax=Aerosticca soli TaxID=2010829 RepID=A0A2Z6E835_9GAMM|nr:hypothetical protein [Aerosticca soli]MDI3261088.1 hypothetical protein [Nevskiaceae bacterium]BBD81303.1 hypothetical protein ALSL_2679 [Aerosticca soli]
MDEWSTLIRLPMTVLLFAAALAAIFALVQLAAMLRRRREGRPLAAAGRFLALLIGLALACLLAGTGLALRGYRLLAEEAPVLDIDAHILSPQRWQLQVSWPDGATRRLELAGDAFRVEAVVLKWKLPAVLAGVPPLYRLDRIDGRYDEAAQEAQAPRTVVDFAPSGWDLLELRRRYPQWLPAVDAVYGSGAFLPLVDGGHYTVSLMRSGALVARPDEATARRLAAPLD